MLTVKKFFGCLLCALFMLPSFVFADGSKDYLSMSLEELLNTKVTVASVKAKTLKDSPGIISLITSEEIANSGARSLIDILRLIPGFDFGIDVQGQIGITVRGNWANEGKVSLMLDGQELNDLLYSTLQIYNRFPVDQIKKIEIIRGPGSAIYGGLAELAVINIVTKDAKDIDGVSISAAYGQMPESVSRKELNLSYGKSFSNGIDLAGSVFLGEAITSDRAFTDSNGMSFSLADSNKQQPFNVNLKIDYNGLKTRLIADKYHTKQRDESGTDIGEPINTDFDSYVFDISYDYKLSDKLTLTPRINYNAQTPWKEGTVTTSTETLTYDKSAVRYTSGLKLAYDPSESFNVVAGAEIMNEKATDNLENSLSFDGNESVSYSNTAVYLQGLFINPIANITMGARYDNSSEYSSSFVPRLGFTKVINKLHFKLLASKAFRSPGIENIRLNKDIKPENTTTLELESGYQISQNSLVSVNVFDIKIDKPIVYWSDNTNEAYLNYDLVSTRGFELEYRTKSGWGYTNFNYSFYKVTDNTVDKYQVPGNNDILLGAPAHKLTANASIQLMKNMSMNPSLFYLSERYAYGIVDSNGDPILMKYDPLIVANIYLYLKDFCAKNTDFGVGIYNLTDAKYDFVQPYNGSHPPLPGPSRELIFKVSYKF